MSDDKDIYYRKQEQLIHLQELTGTHFSQEEELLAEEEMKQLRKEMNEINARNGNVYW